MTKSKLTKTLHITTISLSKEDWDIVEKIAKKYKLSRSAVIRMSLIKLANQILKEENESLYLDK